RTGGGTVLLDPEDAVLLQRFVKSREPRGDRALALHPVHAAEQENGVERAVLRQPRIFAVDDGGLHLPEELRRFVEEEREPARPERSAIRRGALRIGRGDDQLAALREERSEQLGVPTFTRTVLEHGHLRRDADELER